MVDPSLREVGHRCARGESGNRAGSIGTYDLFVRGDNATSGGFKFDVYLVADANGDRSVDTLDLDLLRTMSGAVVGSPNYDVAADANLDGRIDSFDVFQWQLNRNDSTLVNPLNLTFEVAVAGQSVGTTVASIPDDTDFQVRGTTSPIATVGLDVDGDGQPDFSTTPDGTGAFSFDLRSADPGFEQYRLFVSDRFGQSQEGSIDLTVVESFGITEFSPASGEAMVSTTRHGIVRFTEPVDAGVDIDAAIDFIALGQVVPGQFRLSSSGMFVIFLPANPWPASTEIRTIVNGDLITSGGDLLDADGDGLPGGLATVDFRTVPLTRSWTRTCWAVLWRASRGRMATTCR